MLNAIPTPHKSMPGAGKDSDDIACNEKAQQRKANGEANTTLRKVKTNSAGHSHHALGMQPRGLSPSKEVDRCPLTLKNMQKPRKHFWKMTARTINVGITMKCTHVVRSN